MKTPVVLRTNYVLYLENYQDTSFIHCDCFKWNKTIKTDLVNDVDSLVKLHGCPIFAFHNIEDSKHRKFLEIMNFRFYSDIYCPTDGKVRQLFVRSA